MIKRSDLLRYASLNSLYTDIETIVTGILRRKGYLMQAAQYPKSDAARELSGKLYTLIDIVDELSAEVSLLEDNEFDVAAWMMYFNHLERVFRLWWRLPALMGTGNSLDDRVFLSAQEHVLSIDESLENVSVATGVPWPVVAQGNDLDTSDEFGASWPGTTLNVPGGSSASAKLPFILGSQEGAKVLGRDFSNDLTLSERELSPSFETQLNGSINSSTTTITVDSVAGVPTGTETKYARIDSEIISFTGVSGSNLTGVVRGVRGTSAAAHNDNAFVYVVPVVWSVSVLSHGDTFMQGINNTIEDSPLTDIIGQDFGPTKNGIIMITLLATIKSDPRVKSISNVQTSIVDDRIVATMDISSIGNLSTYTLKRSFTGDEA